MPEPTDEQTDEIRAAIGLLGHLHGLSELPALDPDAEPVRLPEPEAALETIAGASSLHPSLRLELLARSVRARRDEESLRSVDLRGLADSLVREESDAGVRSTTERLLDRLAESEAGRDPLARTVADLVEPDELVRALHADIQSTVLMMLPQCDASLTTQSGVAALNIVTESATYKPLADFRTIVDPRKWPSCWLQHAFFTKMETLDGPHGTTAPDQGWSARLRETVDFGFGLGPPQQAVTHLDVVFFENLAPPTPAVGPAVGCTYDFAGSEDDKIDVDQGYLLVEEVPHPTGAYRRYRTQKLVHFKDTNPPPEDVCSVWSLAAGMIEQGC